MASATFDLEKGDTGGVSVLESVFRISGEERRFLCWTEEVEEGSAVVASLVVTPGIR